MMSHDTPYAAARIEEQGYGRAKDIFAYICSVNDDLPAPILRRIRKGPPEGVTLRMLDMSRFDAEVGDSFLTGILNDAWSGELGLHAHDRGRNQGPGLHPQAADRQAADLVRRNGRRDHRLHDPAAQDINEAIADLKGRLFPLAGPSCSGGSR